MDFSDQARLARSGSEGLYADIDDIRLHFVREGDGEPLLLIHGGFGAGGFWRPVMDCLSGLDLIAPDSRGQGRSTDGRGPITYGRMAGDMVRLLDHLGVERAHVAGHSDGGCIALHLLVDYPDRVASATLAGTNLHTDDYRDGVIDSMRRFFDAVRGGAEPVGFLWDSHVALNPNPERWPTVVEKLAATWLTEPKFTDDVLALVTTPVLVFVTSGDEYIPRETFERTAQLFSKAEQVEIEGSHFSVVEKPLETATALRDFIAGHPIA
jgi:pimeloyl-ACP methyl ester carboxylesterase